MKFYQSIAEYYEQIFPLNKSQIAFTEKAFIEPKKAHVLDIGCGTGQLAIALSDIVEKVTAIDLNKSMVEKCLLKKYSQVDFRVMDMLEIKQTFKGDKFDGVICFGNTLVHLDGLDSILDFFMQSKSILKKNGKLLFQLINYDNIINNNIQGLPTIENEAVKFVRNYNYHPEENSIDFKTTLTIKENRQQLENSIQLYPLRKIEIDDLLQKSGFSEWTYYGNFKRDKLTVTSLPLVVEAS